MFFGIVARLRRRRDIYGDFVVRVFSDADSDYHSGDWDDAWNVFVALADYRNGHIVEIEPCKSWVIYRQCFLVGYSVS